MHRALNRLLTTSMIAALGVLAGVSATPSHALAAAPVITVPGPQTVNEGALLSFNVSATDADGQPLFFRASALPSGSSFVDNHNNTARFSWTPSYTQAGTYGPTFLVDDTFGGVDSKGVSITVANVNQAPELNPIGDKQVERGSSMSFFVSGSDPDDDPLTLGTVNLPSYASFQDFGGGSGMLSLNPPGNMAPGTTSMTVTLSDGSQTVSETFSIEVYAVGSQFPPVLAPIGNQTVAEGATANVNVSATDQDGESLTWTVSLPGFASFSPTGGGPGSASGTITLAPGYCDAGTYAASLGASDGATTDSESFTITVTDVNRAPAWSLPFGGYSMTLAEGATATLTVHASDPDQACGIAAPALVVPGPTPASLTVTLTDQGSGNGVLRVTASYTAAGTFDLTLRARDAVVSSSTTDVTVHVTVTPTNRAPLADAGGPYSGLMNTAMSMSGSGSSDPDGDALSYSWTFGDGGTGTGVSVTHAYAAAGQYVVTLAVSDGSLSDADTTTADVRSGFLARAFTDHGTIRLKTGKPRETVYLEPLGGSFSVSSVDPNNLKMTGPGGLGTVDYITPIEGSVIVGGDSDRNGVAEVAMDFSKEDLRSLFANLENDMQATLVLTAGMLGGGSVRATLGWNVEPERKLVARIHPNPMNPVATVRVNLEVPEKLTIRFYDMNGRLVRTLLEGVDTPAGVHDILFDGHGTNGQTLPTGQYFYRASTPTAKTSGTVMILK